MVSQTSHCEFHSGFLFDVFKHNDGSCSLMVKRLVVSQVHAGSNPVGYPASKGFANALIAKEL